MVMCRNNKKSLNAMLQINNCNINFKHNDAFRIFYQFISANFSQKWLYLSQIKQFHRKFDKIRANVEYSFVGDQL